MRPIGASSRFAPLGQERLRTRSSCLEGSAGFTLTAPDYPAAINLMQLSSPLLNVRAVLSSSVVDLRGSARIALGRATMR